MKTLGLIVNPIAGIGGRVGLKGSDGPEILQRALDLGANPEAPGRAIEALKVLHRSGKPVRLITYPADMGEEECRQANLEFEVVGAIERGKTTAEDTRRAARDLVARGVDLLLFAGGDGTARDLCAVVDQGTTVLGIPAGVKIHSAVFAVTPRGAGELAAHFVEGRVARTRLAEVMDIDEDAFRGGTLVAKLFGYLRIPDDVQHVQGGKVGGVQSERAALLDIGEHVLEMMEGNDAYFILGPGSTTAVIAELMGQEKTLLGVDVARQKQLLAKDVSEDEILRLIQDHPAKIVVTVIGGQGHVFGRGNQQISPRVIRQVGKDNVLIIATPEKLRSLGRKPLLVDTGDEELDRALSGYAKVLTGYMEYSMRKVEG